MAPAYSRALIQPLGTYRQPDGLETGTQFPNASRADPTIEAHAIKMTFYCRSFLTSYFLITRVYECILPCMYNDVCNAECGLQLLKKVDTYLLGNGTRATS